MTNQKLVYQTWANCNVIVIVIESTVIVIVKFAFYAMYMQLLNNYLLLK